MINTEENNRKESFTNNLKIDENLVNEEPSKEDIKIGKS